MSNASDLLEDIFTFLCFLGTNDTRPRGRRFLPPSALAALNAQLRQPDHPTPRRECDAPRIRFVHFLCEAAQFVARIGEVLKPTPQALTWFSAPPDLRLMPFARLLRSDQEAVDELWRAYRLPGWRYFQPRASFHAIAQALTDRPGGISPDALAQVVPIPFHDDPDAQPPAVVRELVTCLAWLGWVERHRGKIRLSEPGARMLAGQEVGWPPAAMLAPSPQPSLTIAPNGDLVATPTADWSALYSLGDYADLIGTRPQRRYRLSAARVQAALARGATPGQIAGALEALTGDALPPDLFNAIQSWAHEFGRLRLRRVTLLESRDADLMADLLRQRGIRACVHPLSPHAAVVRPDRTHAVIRRLRWRGLAPQVALAEPPTQRRPFEQPALAQLYLAVRLCHRLADVLPAGRLVPYSLALDIERQLTTGDREAVELLIEACVPGPAPRDDQQGDVLSALAEALAAHMPIDILYRARGAQAASARRIEPRRLEWRFGVAYVTAWCHRAAAERVFRADRIVGITRSSTSPVAAAPAPGRPIRSS